MRAKKEGKRAAQGEGKKLFAGIKEKILGWSIRQKAAAGVTAAVVLVGAVGGGIVAWQMTHQTKDDPQVAKETVVAVSEPKVTESEVEVPSFTDFNLSSESLVKDLTIYFTDGSNNKISGVPFSVVIASTGEADAVSDYTKTIVEDSNMLYVMSQTGLGAAAYSDELLAQVEEIITSHDGNPSAAMDDLAALAEDLNAGGETDEAAVADDETDIEEAEDTAEESKNEDADEAENNEDAQAADEDTEILKNAATGEPITLYDYYLVTKQTDIVAYANALTGVNGTTYSDDDNDGMIYIKEIEGGDYVALYVPQEGYDTAKYANNVSVKAELEYKPVENIKQKTVANAGDTQPAAAAPQEATLTDTISVIPSSTEVKHEYAVGNAEGFSSSVSGSQSATFKGADGTDYAGASMTVNGSAATLYAVSGNNAASIPVSFSGITPTEVTATSDNTGAVTTSATTSAVTVTAATLLSQQATANVTVTAKGNVSVDTSARSRRGFVTASETTTSVPVTATVSFKVTVVPSTTPLTTSAGETLYTSNNDATAKEATIADAGSTLYTRKEQTIYHGWQNLNNKQYYFDANGNPVTGEQVIGGVKYNFGSDGALLVNGTGVDVSKWQGNIDWGALAPNISFAIIRCGYRGSSGNLAVDPKYAQNMKNAKANGVRVGVYIYSKAQNEAQAVEEASLAIQLVREQGGVSLPIYIDIEDNATQGGLSKDQLTSIANAFCATVSSAGYRPGVYASYSWFTNKMNTGSINGSIWCARYNTYCGLSYRYDIWQYSSKGSMPGISGNVDMNQSYF